MRFRTSLQHKSIITGLLLFLPLMLSASYDQVPGGGRPSGLGGAFVGLANSADALFYNPAGLALLQSIEFSGMGSTMKFNTGKDRNLADTNLALCLPAWNVSGKRLTGTAGIGIRMFSFQDYYNQSSIGMFYGTFVRQWLAAGAGVSYMNVSYDEKEYLSLNSLAPKNASSSALSFDAGLLFLPKGKITYGLAVRDIRSGDDDVLYRDDLAPSVSAGAAYREADYTFVSDVISQKDTYKMVLGAEKWFASGSVPVRVGAGMGNKEYSSVSIGSGYKSGPLLIDCAYTYPLSGITKTNATLKLSAGYTFNSPVITVAAKTKSNSEEPASEKKNKKPDMNDDPLYKKSQDARLLVNIAISAIKEGEYMKSIDMLRQAVEMDPEEKKYAEMKKKIEFVTTYIFFCVGKDRVDDATRNAIYRYSVEDEVKEGVEMLQYAYSLKPDNDNLYKLIKALAKEYDIPIDNSARTWNLAEQKVYQALEKFRQKKFDECIKLCEEALDLEPTNVTAYKRLGSTFYIIGDLERAKENWEKVVELAPNDEDTQQIRSLLRKVEHDERQMKKR